MACHGEYLKTALPPYPKKFQIKDATEFFKKYLGAYYPKDNINNDLPSSIKVPT